MAYTVKYCTNCNRDLSPQDESSQAKTFINASRSIGGIRPRFTGPIIEKGVCFGCGKEDYVTYYELLTDAHLAPNDLPK